MKKVTDLSEREVIHCSSKQEAEALLKLFKESGLNWDSGHSYDVTDTMYSKDNGGTCYRPNYGSWGSKDFYTRELFTVYEAKEFLTKFKRGDSIKAVKTGANNSNHSKRRILYTGSDLGKVLGVIESIEPDSTNEFLIAITDTGFALRIEEYADHFEVVGTINKTPVQAQKTIKDMRVTKTKTVPVKGVDREVTVIVLIDNNKVRAGYSVKNPEDKTNRELASTIAKGRALNDRTNLVDMTIGSGMAEKYILFAIAENLIQRISEGSIDIKGIKTPKTTPVKE